MGGSRPCGHCNGYMSSAIWSTSTKAQAHTLLMMGTDGYLSHKITFQSAQQPENDNKASQSQRLPNHSVKIRQLCEFIVCQVRSMSFLSGNYLLAKSCLNVWMLAQKMNDSSHSTRGRVHGGKGERSACKISGFTTETKQTPLTHDICARISASGSLSSSAAAEFSFTDEQSTKLLVD